MDSVLSWLALSSVLAVVTSSLVPVAELFPPKSYKFGYAIKDKHGGQYREEAGDGLHDVKGSYGFVDERGVRRQVNYVADKEGFRAEVKTNEPGTAPENPAGVKMTSVPFPGDTNKAESAEKESSLAELEKLFKGSVAKEGLGKGYDEKDFFTKGYLGKKIAAEEVAVEKEGTAAEAELSLEELSKLGFVLPPFLEMYGAGKGLEEKTPSYADLGNLKYLDELILLSLLAKGKAAVGKDLFLGEAAGLGKMKDANFAFAPLKTKKFYPSFIKETTAKKGLRFESLMKGINKKSSSFVPFYGF